MLFFQREHKHIIIFHVIAPHWHDTGSWYPSSCKTRTYLAYMVNIMAADGLATQGARASATMILTLLNRIISAPHVKGLNVPSMIGSCQLPPSVAMTSKMAVSCGLLALRSAFRSVARGATRPQPCWCQGYTGWAGPYAEHWCALPQITLQSNWAILHTVCTHSHGRDAAYLSLESPSYHHL